MIIKVRIARSSVFIDSEEILDAQGNPTGDYRHILHVSFVFPDYPKVGTKGLNFELPVTKQQIKDAIELVAAEEKTKMTKTEQVRDIVFEQEEEIIFEFDL